MGGGEGGGEAHGSCCVPFDGLLCCWSSLTLIYSHKSFVSFVIYRHVKDSATAAGLAPASVCSTLRCVHSTVHTSLFSQRIKDSATMAGLAPCERVFHAQVCALQITHISILAARQRQCHDGRACAPVSVCSTLWCVHFSAHMHTHLSILVAHQRKRHDGGACPLRACVPRSGVCASNHTHLYSRSTSKTVPRCERVFHARVCDIQRTHLSVLAARQRPRHEVPPDLRCPAKRRMSPARGHGEAM